MATITILSKILIPATQLQPERVKVGISSSDATLIQSSPNDLSLTFTTWFGVPNYNINVNEMYIYQPLPPYNNYWFIIQEGSDFFIYFNTNPYTYTYFLSYESWDSFGFPFSIPVEDPNYVTLISYPDFFSPVYNPIVFTFSSPKYSEVGYRYLVDIKDPSDNIINRLKVVPRPDGTGYIDIQKILSNYVSVDYLDVPFKGNCPNSYLQYKVSLGEEYLSSWEYTNFVEQIGGIYDGYVVLNQTNTSILHTYQPGDLITIDTDTSGLAQNVGGLHQVLLVPNNYQVVIDVIYPNDDPSIAIPGSTTYSDSRKTGYSNLTTIDNLIVYNGVFSWNDWTNMNSGDYIISGVSTTNKLLTSLSGNNSEYHLRNYMDLDQSYFINYATSLDININVKWINNNSVSSSFSIDDIVLNGVIRQFRLSYNDLVNYGVPENSEWVRFYLEEDESGDQLTESTTIYFDRRCKINNIHIYFMDKLGSILSIPFQLRDNQSISIERDVNKIYNNYQYRESIDLTQGGDTINYISSKKVYGLNTNWMNDKQMKLFEIMMESPYTWISMDGVNQSCIIEDTSLEVEKYKNKSLFRKSVKIRLSNQDPLNI